MTEISEAPVSVMYWLMPYLRLSLPRETQAAGKPFGEWRGKPRRWRMSLAEGNNGDGSMSPQYSAEAAAAANFAEWMGVQNSPTWRHSRHGYM